MSDVPSESCILSEREKMLAGELYQAGDPELVHMRATARRLTRAYNASTEEEAELRKRILSDLLGKTGDRITIEPPFRCDYGAHIYAGEDLYMNFGCVVLDCAEVHFGDGVMCGPNVQIYTATHPLDAGLRTAGPELARSIQIGNRVWIGGSAILCPGVSIGDNSTIGAGSVVTRNIPANVVAAGNPCRVIRDL
eukprot:ANDGO_00412.mRNA.1 putative maltose O-acetyltransferase